MKQILRKTLAISFASAALLVAGPVQAEEVAEMDAVVDDAPAESPRATDEGFALQFAGGFKGGLAGVAGRGFENDGRVTGNDGVIYEFPRPEYYGHFGMNGGGGLALEVRAMNFVGLEFGVHYAANNARGYVDKNQAGTNTTITRIYSDQSTTAMHIPVLLKLNVPGKTVRPFFGVGMEFVLQRSSDIEYWQDPQAGAFHESEIQELNQRNSIEPTNYSLFLVTAGIEIAFNQIRIPIELRAGYNLGYGESMDDRAWYDAQSEQIIYNGQFLGHFAIFTGLLYEFDLRL